MVTRKFVLTFFVIYFIFSCSMTAQYSSHEFNLMPYPEKIQKMNGKLRLDEDFSVSCTLDSERLKKAANRFSQRLANKTGIFIDKPFAEITDQRNDYKLRIIVEQVSELKLNKDESYSVNVTSDSIILLSNTDIGALRGLETILQLISSDSTGYFLPCVKIEDKPRFPWRGLMIDACRHFMPVDVIKRNLDGMAAVKMNVLHWHLSEDQGFRVESKVYPKLHELGSDGFYYTQEQIKNIISYAGDRGIRVVPEFDVPGHATAILTAYPEFASAPGPYKIERGWGVHDPTLNPIDERTYIFLHNLFSEMAELFPDDFFHIGGDENNGKQWNVNDEIQEFMSVNNIKDNSALQAYFNNKILKILTNLEKKMIGWDEIFHPSMPNNIVIQSWRGKKALIESAKKGYQSILSEGYYIDLNYPADVHYLNDPLSKDTDLTDSEKLNVLGGEATMWSEFVSPEIIDSRIWPRTAAIAERFWSPQECNDISSMYERLENISYQLEEHGLTHIKNQEIMLRRLTGNREIESLRTLINVIEPVKEYRRNSLRRHTQQSPLTRVVDTAVPDASEARIFRDEINEFLKTDDSSSSIFKSIKNKLLIWKNNHSKLQWIIEKSPILFEIEPMSKNLSKLAELGLQILDAKSKKIKLDDVEKEKSKKLIELCKKPVAQTELMITSAIEKLFNTQI